MKCKSLKKCNINCKNKSLKSIQPQGKKNMEDIDNSIKEILNFMSFLSGNTMPVGSFLFKEHAYPGDIDLCETIYECCTDNLEHAKKKIVIRIQTAIKKILLHQPKIYFSDFKAGIDKRFNLSLRGNTTHIKNKLIKLKKYIKKDDYKNLEVILENNDVNAFEKILHEYKIIRWDFIEILKGEKIKNGKIFKLEDAISCGEVVKLDVWYKNMDRYIEITNFLNICVSDENENTCKKYLSKPMGNLSFSLISDIEKYYENKNYLKCLKRIWSLLNHIKNQNKNISLKFEKQRKKIIPVFRKKPAELSQIQSDLEVIEQMANKFNKYSRISLYPANDILYYFLNMQNRIKDIIKSKKSLNDIIDSHDFIDNLFVNIIAFRDLSNITQSDEKYWTKNRKEEFINVILKDIQNIINFINEYYECISEEWLIEKNINLELLIKQLKEKLIENNLINNSEV